MSFISKIYTDSVYMSEYTNASDRNCSCFNVHLRGNLLISVT